MVHFVVIFLICSYLLSIWNVCDRAIFSIELPLVKGTFYAISNYFATDSQIGTQVWAVCICNVRSTATFFAVDCKFRAKTRDMFDSASWYLEEKIKEMIYLVYIFILRLLNHNVL